MIHQENLLKTHFDVLMNQLFVFYLIQVRGIYAQKRRKTNFLAFEH